MHDDIWVVTELVGKGLASVSLQLLGKARQLADQADGKVMAVAMGHQIMPLAQEIVEHGADEVLVADHPELAYYRTLPYARVLTELVQERKPNVVLLGATSQGRDLAPRVAARLQTGLTADCLELHIDDQGLLVQTKPSYGDNVMVDIVIPDHRPQMATVRPNVFPLPKRMADRQGKVSSVTVTLQPDDLRTVVKDIMAEEQEAFRLEEADVVICGGRGMGSKENFEQLYALAQAFGGVVGATRPPADEGWINPAFQIGQSGKMVAPKLFIACGVSGAVQFTVGMEKSKTVVAINKDAAAPIFDFATYGIVGDTREIIPALLQELTTIQEGKTRSRKESN
ncbi:MAG: electron transfer flavoprotein subunit alpha/FixB family protein [bacterium]|jgi:electron transfer flavoprotein alpha subunit